jgi:HSP20 family protein
MAGMYPFYPFREIEELSNLLERLWGSRSGLPVRHLAENRWGIPLDVAETDEAFLIKASLPGVQPDDIAVSLSGNTLTIQCIVKPVEIKEGEQFYLQERRSGKFSRSLKLPTQVNPDQIEADYVAGVLTLRLPKAEEVKPKRITVKPAKAGKMIDGKFEKIASKN